MTVFRYFYIVAAFAFALLAHSLSPELGYLVDRDSDIFSQLAAQLSRNATIITPNDPRMQTTHQRWQAYSMPTYSVVVEVAVEEDVQKTVRFANKHSLPFLAVDGAHGFISSLRKMQGGIAISFIKMKGIKISHSGEYADFQPGLTNGDVIRGLWAEGKQTVTANCLCTGVMGVMLGGGHGYLQGLYGLPADQILEARVVLADGNSVTASAKSNRDLFWALRGAGHNFGIVTGLKYRVYERFPKWTEIRMIFTQDKLEEVFELSNNYIEEDDHPAQLVLWYTFMRRPDVDPDSAIIEINFIYRGNLARLETFAAPFRVLGPAREEIHTEVPYPEIFNINGINESSPVVCGKGMYRHLFPTYLKRHNPTALRKVHDIFNNMTAKYPNIASTSIFVIEGYPAQAVTSVPSDSTAVPFRRYPLLLSPVWAYTDPAYSNDIIAASKQMRQILVDSSESQKLHAYVNYAFGDETLPEMYGDEPWRLQKLRKLKKKYDPKGRFNFYAPIVGDSN